MPAIQPSRTAVLAALDRVIDPASGKGIAAAGLVQGLSIGEGKVGFMLEVDAAQAAVYAPVRDAAEKALLSIGGVHKAQVVLTTTASPAAKVAPSAQPRQARVSIDPKADTQTMPPAERLAHVHHVIAVASGKGGVGKSTVSVNLACAFARLGLKAGLLDADIYGPSAPRMMGASGKPIFSDGKLNPLSGWGVRVMSIGFIIEEGSPMIWRGPMASSAMRQMIEDVRWGTEISPLDVLVVDLPPGTGDIHLTMVQKLAVDGVVIVSTPQEIALIDARRASAMFQKMNPPVPILGVIENMAYFPDPATGERIAIFGTGGARVEADRLKAPFLGEVPIDIALREAGDEGRPLVATAPDSPSAKVFLEMARRLYDRVQQADAR